MRVFLSAVAFLMFLVGSAVAQNPTQQSNQPSDQHGKVHHKGHARHAKIVNIDPQKGTVTVQMKGRNGKSRIRTFHLTEDIEYADSTGRVARVDMFRSGDEVLIVEEKGKLKQLSQAPKHHKTGASSGQNPPVQPGGVIHR